MTARPPHGVVRGVRRRFVDAGRVRTHLVEAGEGRGLVLWLPALMDCATGWGRVLLRLAGRLHGVARVGAVDPPGYGDSPRLEGSYTPSFAELEDWLQGVIGTTTGPLILVGNSSGAVPATAVAAADQRVCGLVLVGWADWRLVGPPHRELLCPATEQDLDRLLDLSWHRPPSLTAAARRSYLDRSRGSDFCRHVASFDPEAYGRHLDRYRRSVALVGGRNDRIITPDMVQALAARRPEATLDWIDECGHHPHKEQPGRLAAILDARVREMLRRRIGSHCLRARARGPFFAGDSHGRGGDPGMGAPVHHGAVPR